MGWTSKNMKGKKGVGMGVWVNIVGSEEVGE